MKIIRNVIISLGFLLLVGCDLQEQEFSTFSDVSVEDSDSSSIPEETEEYDVEWEKLKSYKTSDFTAYIEEVQLLEQLYTEILSQESQGQNTYSRIMSEVVPHLQGITKAAHITSKVMEEVDAVMEVHVDFIDYCVLMNQAFGDLTVYYRQNQEEFRKTGQEALEKAEVLFQEYCKKVENLPA